MEFTGLPLHALVVHAAVVLTPLAVLAAWAYALLPAWRWLSRWGALLAAVAATGTVAVARVSGEALLEDRPFLTSGESTVADLLQKHQDRAGVLLVAIVVFLVVVALAFWLLPAPTGLASGRMDHAGRPGAWIRVGLPAAMVVLGLVVLVFVVLTGDAGSRAVWG